MLEKDVKSLGKDLKSLEKDVKLMRIETKEEFQACTQRNEELCHKG